MHQRWELWRATCALIKDHPQGVGPDTAMALLDAWYLPTSYYHRFGTSLNEGLTLIAWYGIVSGIAASLALGATVAVAIGLALRRNLWGLLGLTWISTAFIGGSFQSHALGEYGWGIGWWVLGLTWIVIGIAQRGVSWRIAIRGVIYGGGLASAVIIAICIVGDAPWRTSYRGADLVASPRAQIPTRSLAVVNLQAYPHRLVRPWVDRLADSSTNIIDVRSLPHFDGTAFPSPTLLAEGTCASDVFSRWWLGEYAGIPVILCDPLNISGRPDTMVGSNLTIRYAPAAPFVDASYIESLPHRYSGISVEEARRATSAGWWTISK